MPRRSAASPGPWPPGPGEAWRGQIEQADRRADVAEARAVELTTELRAAKQATDRARAEAQDAAQAANALRPAMAAWRAWRGG